MAENEITSSELGRRIDSLSKQIAISFGSIDARLSDLTLLHREMNGRLGRVEQSAAVEIQKVLGIEIRQTAEHLESAKNAAALSQQVEAVDSKSVTRRDVAIVGGTLAILFEVFQLGQWLWAHARL